MKIDDMLELARDKPGNLTMVATLQLHNAVVEKLGPAIPCGMESPPIVSRGDGTCGVLVDDRGDPLDPEEARGWAAAILRAADECEEQNR